MPQGKVIGGSSKLNNMIYVRGNISHYVNWFNGRYNMDYITKQFEFIEKNIFHINEIQYQSEFSDAVIEAAHELGYQTLNKEFAQGFTKVKLTQKNGKRWATSDLVTKHLISNGMVENILFNGNSANGVSVDIFGKKYKFFGRKGVILSAGALNTPKILQLSGVGPENVLKPLKIPIKKVLPVGQKLQDHVAAGLDLVMFNKTVSINVFDMINPINVIKYFINGCGPLTTPGCEAIGFLSTKGVEIPDLQYMILPVGISSDRGSLLRNNLGIKDDVFDNYFGKIFHKFAATFLAVVLHPTSTGEVYITSRDPKEHPFFDPKYLSHTEDRKVLIEGLKMIPKLLDTKAMKNIGASLNKIHFPGCDMYNFFSDEYLNCYISHLTLSSYHPIGTCSLGLPDSKNTVVDLSFKVLGVDNLFVADASVLPTMPSGNINAAVAMMASIFFESNIKKTVDANIKYCYKNYFYNVLNKVCLKSEAEKVVWGKI